MNYADIKKYDIANGTGIRVTLFVSGCTHHCKGCFNQETWDFNSGKEMTMDEVLDIVKRNKFNVTFSGGDPMYQAKELCELAKNIHSLGYTIWCYTGYIYENIKDKEPYKSVLKYIDVLCDGPFIQEKKSPNKPWVGSENQRVIDVKKSFASNSVVLYE